MRRKELRATWNQPAGAMGCYSGSPFRATRDALALLPSLYLRSRWKSATRAVRSSDLRVNLPLVITVTITISPGLLLPQSH